MPLDIIPPLALFNFPKSVTPAYLMCENCALGTTLATLATFGYGLELSYEDSSWKKYLFC
jgi:hypothetical protein